MRYSRDTRINRVEITVWMLLPALSMYRVTMAILTKVNFRWKEESQVHTKAFSSLSTLFWGLYQLLNLIFIHTIVLTKGDFEQKFLSVQVKNSSQTALDDSYSIIIGHLSNLQCILFCWYPHCKDLVGIAAIVVEMRGSPSNSAACCKDLSKYPI